MEIFPAVLIGGPPHRGKSVLLYHLSQALRRRGVEHYALRAAPDGEGDWASEIEQSRVRLIRMKDEWTPAWVERISRDIAARHLPLLVDVGGKPQPWQEEIIGRCTHAVLLYSQPDELAWWQALARRHGLTIVAELESQLAGQSALRTTAPLFRARLTRLERDAPPLTGPVFAALVDHLTIDLAFSPAELSRINAATAPLEQPLDLAQLARQFHLAPAQHWQPAHLPRLLQQLPAGRPLALYGRGPNWLLAAVARQTYPAPFYQFDPRLGWVTPPPLRLEPPRPDAPFHVRQLERTVYTEFAITLAGGYLDYPQGEALVAPPAPKGRPLLLSGPLPLWLYTALARAYTDAPLLAIHQPMAGHVVIHATRPPWLPGDLLPPAS